MSNGFILTSLIGAFLGALLVVPFLLDSFSALELVFGRYLVFGGLILSILLFRLDTLWKLSRVSSSHYFLMVLTGNLLYYLFLIMGARQLGGTTGCLLVVLLPMVFWRLRERSSFLLGSLVVAILVFCVGSLTGQPAGAAIYEQLPGMLCLFVAGVCWYWSATQQLQILRTTPGMDASDHLILNGLFSLLGLIAMIPLAMFGQEEFQLFASDRNHEELKSFWFYMFMAGGLGTLLVRLLWKRSVRQNHCLSHHHVSILEGFFGMAFIIAVEARLPSPLEWGLIFSLYVVWITFYRSLRYPTVIDA